jgi:coenzyme F420-reducing hydrogenase delta subunit
LVKQLFQWDCLICLWSTLIFKMKNQLIKISLFHCSNSISLEEINQIGSQLGQCELNTISVPCSGKIATEYILKSIEMGSDAAILAGCMVGECKLLQGNLRARKRIDAINDLLNETGIGSDCVWFVQIDNKNKTDNFISELTSCILQIIKEQEKTTEIF